MGRRILFSIILCLSGFGAFGQTYQLNGNATALGGDCFRLTAAQNSQSGSVWALNQIDLSQPFDIYFGVFLGCSNPGADGMAFVLQPVSTAIGGVGGGMGYQGITPSLAIELDTYQNASPNLDPANDHMAIMSNGVVNHATANNLQGPVSILPGGGNVEDCMWHDMRVTWDTATFTMQVYFDCSLRMTYSGNIVANIFSGNPNVYWGFTAATGGLNNLHQVCFEYLSFVDGLQDTTKCASDTLQISAGPGTAFAWTPNVDISDPTVANPKFFPTTTTTYYVSITDSCGATRIDSMVIGIVPCPLTPTVTINRTNCFDVQYIVQSGGGFPPYTYFWSGSSGLSGSNDTINITYPGPGAYNYSVSVTDAAAAGANVSGVLNLQNLAFANAGKDTTLCPNETALLGTPALPGQTYQWQGITSALGLPPGAARQNAQVGVSFSNTTSAPLTVCYELIATDTVGCEARDTVCVTYTPKPPVSISVQSPVCQGQPSTVAFTGFAPSGITYSWGFGTGLDATGANTSTAQGPHQVTWSAPTSGSQTVTLQIAVNGCLSDVVSDVVTVVPIPSSAFSVISPVCEGQSTVLTYQGSASAAATATWGLAGGTITSGSGLGPLTVSWASTGPKIITLSVLDQGCISNTTIDTVLVQPTPTSTFNVSPSTCLGDSVQVTYTGNGSPGATYTWNFGSGGASGAGQGTFRVAWSASGLQQICLNVQENGCFSPATCNTVNVLDKPVVQIDPVSDQCLQGNSFNFTSTATPGVTSYSWGFPGGSPSFSNLATPPAVSYPTAGTKTVSLFVTINGCVSDTAYVSFDVNPEPNADFNISATNACTGDTVSFTYAGIPVGPNQTYAWNFGVSANPATSSLTNPAPVFYSSPGTKTISLIVTYRGCTDAVAKIVNVNQGPSLNAGPTLSFCEGSGGVQINAVTTGGTGPFTYTWSCDVPACGISNPGVEDPVVNPSTSGRDTITYTGVVTDVNGCQSLPAMVDVIVNPRPLIDAGPDLFLCEGGVGATLQGGVAANNQSPGPFTWQWSDLNNNVPPHGITAPNDKQPVSYANPDTTMIYTLIATDQSTGCSSDTTTVSPLSSLVVNVNPLPIAHAGADTAICFGDSVQLQAFASSGSGSYTYAWSPISTGFFSNPNAASPVVSPNFTTTYTMVVTSNGCVSLSDVVTVFVETVPTADAGPDHVICLGDTVRLDGSAGGAPNPFTDYQYQWIPGNSVNDPTTSNPLAYPTSTTTYQMIATSSRGCGADTSEVTVTLKSTPVARVLTPDTTICKGSEILLRSDHSFTTTPPPPPGSQVVYEWSPRASIIGTRFGPRVRVKPVQTTLYTVTTSINGQCPTTDFVRVTVNPVPDVAILASETIICEGDQVNLTATGSLGAATFDWSPGLTLNDSTIVDPIAVPGATTTYFLHVEEGPCSADTQITITVYPYPVADYFSTQPFGCEGLEVNFMENTQNANSWIWNFGDGTPVVNEPNPIHVYPNAGTYRVTLIVPGIGGCEDTASHVVVTVGGSSFADFTSDPDTGFSQPLPGAPVSFMDLSINSINWIWDFGDGNSSALQHPSHIFREEGEYFVTLTATDSNGCISKVTRGPYIVYGPTNTIFNVFSPNGDGINDTYGPQYDGKETFHMEIFDRWGKQYFVSESASDTWDGTAPTGNPAAEGVYYYVIKIGEKAVTGNLTLVR